MSTIRRVACVVTALGIAGCGALFGAVSRKASGRPIAPGYGSISTTVRLKSPGWWPTKGYPGRDEYIGAAACASCHASEAAAFQTAAMAHAATPATEAESLNGRVPLTFQSGPFHYQINSVNEKRVLTISKPGSSLSENLLWAFGMGYIAQTYVYEEKGSYYESHLSFYRGARALDITPGHPHTPPPSLEEGAGRRMLLSETQRCYGCHTTASTAKNRFNPAALVAGVSCEACHGPGADHAIAAATGKEEESKSLILNPAHLSPKASVDFCGTCHRTYQDVVEASPKRIGALNVRFTPYRLENSKCWRQSDGRITCISCHNPHQPLARDPASYDLSCLQCHAATAGAKATTDHPGAACPVGTKLCVTCHMPKLRNSDMHFAFTDHWIRIAAPGAVLPD